MIDEFLTFLVLTPGWITGLLLLAIGSRTRGLARPLWNAERAAGVVVAHERWLLGDDGERTGIVVDFVDRSGRAGRLVEPPVRWERRPAVGDSVKISYRGHDLEFAKRFSRRRQALAWMVTLVSLPIVVLFLLTHPLLMGVVITPQIAWLAARRWRPPEAPVRVPTDLSAAGVGGFDPSAMVVPTSPPPLDPPVPVVRASSREHRSDVDRAAVLELIHRHLYTVVSGMVVLTVALIGATRSSHALALGWHVGLATMLGLGIVLFETSLAYRGGSVVAGHVVDHHHRRESEGDVYWLEVVEFRSDQGVVTFVDTAGPRRQRPTGSPVTVSHRPGEPERARSLHRSQSLLGTLLIAGAVGVGLFISAPTWVPVMIQATVCYLGYLVLDVVRGLATGTPALEAN